MPAGDASLKTAQLIKMLVDSNHGIYRDPPHGGIKFSLAAWDVDFLVRFGCVIIVDSDCKHRETAVPSASCL
jgi:hypothetical protein